MLLRALRMQLWRTRLGLPAVRCVALRADLTPVLAQQCCSMGSATLSGAKGRSGSCAQRLQPDVQRGVETVADVMTKGKIHCVREWTPIDNGEEGRTQQSG